MKPMPAAVKAGYVAPYDSWANRLATYRFVKDIPLTNDDPGYETLQAMGEGLAQFKETPVLICWGAKDFVFDDDFLAMWQQHVPHAEVKYYSDAGHYVLEDETEAVCGEIETFLGR